MSSLPTPTPSVPNACELTVMNDNRCQIEVAFSRPPNVEGVVLVVHVDCAVYFEDGTKALTSTGWAVGEDNYSMNGKDVFLVRTAALLHNNKKVDHVESRIALKIEQVLGPVATTVSDDTGP